MRMRIRAPKRRQLRRLPQCRRVVTFGPADLAGAVTDFLRGSWAQRAKRFVVATSFDTRRTEIAESLEREATKLRDAGVGLDLWGRDDLSLRLKALPALERIA